jgi:hypothetical protein
MHLSIVLAVAGYRPPATPRRSGATGRRGRARPRAGGPLAAPATSLAAVAPRCQVVTCRDDSECSERRVRGGQAGRDAALVAQVEGEVVALLGLVEKTAASQRHSFGVVSEDEHGQMPLSLSVARAWAYHRSASSKRPCTEHRYPSRAVSMLVIAAAPTTTRAPTGRRRRGQARPPAPRRTEPGPGPGRAQNAQRRAASVPTAR